MFFWILLGEPVGYRLDRTAERSKEKGQPADLVMRGLLSFPEQVSNI